VRRRSVRNPTPSKWQSERGQIGGFEVLPFGLLLFVSAMLVITNAWAVVDSKFAASSAAREATRAYTESISQTDADASIERRAHKSLRLTLNFEPLSFF